MGIHPEMFKVVVADPLDSTGKAEERQALMRACLRPPGALAPAFCNSLFMNLGDPCACPQDRDSSAAQAGLYECREVRPRHISGEAGNDRGAKGVRKEEVANGKWELHSEAGNPAGPRAGKGTIQFPSVPR